MMEEELCGERLRLATAVQVCVTCLDTASDKYSMSEYNLEQAYEELTGYPLFNMGNIKHTLCAECAQSLINFNKFRDKSLRARALMMDFVKQHKVVSAAALRPLQAALAPRAAEGEPAVKAEGEGESAVKAEGEEEPAGKGEGEPAVKVEEEEEPTVEEEEEPTVEEEEEPTVEEEGEGQPAVKVEGEGELGADCLLRDAKLLDEARCRVLLTRMSRAEELALAIRVAPLPAKLATNDENNIQPDETEQYETIVKYESVETDNIDTTDEQRVNTSNGCFETTCDALRQSEDAAPEQDESLSTTRKLMCCSASNTQDNDTDSEDFDTQRTSQGEFPILEAVEPVTTHTGVEKLYLYTDNDVGNVVKENNIVPSFSGEDIQEISYFCDVCQHKFLCKNLLVEHIRSHTGENPFSCKLCHYKFKYKSHLARHMRTHTGEKPYACELCQYKCSRKDHLLRHMKTHTGESTMPVSRLIHRSKSRGAVEAEASECRLVKHKYHIEEKLLSCKLCHHKFKYKSNLKRHMTSHTGSKPFACELCLYKCTRNSALVEHMRTHTGYVPFACDLCSYKCNQSSNLLSHMRKHTCTPREPIVCKLCHYKCADKSNFVRHMRTHTGEKPFVCELCKGKFSQKINLVQHMRTHTGEKPFACDLCQHKWSRKEHLVKHMRTHTSEKPILS